jgi:tRNA A58 N-methylase Trm61
MFTIKPFKEIVALTKEKFDETMAPVRAKAAQAKANLKEAEIEERLITLETDIQKLCAEKDLNFDRVIDKMDEYELLTRKKKQVNDLVSALFPDD